LCSVPAGESSKSAASCEVLYSFLLEHGADRHSVVIALGGGVVGDLAGFVAATFMRGIRFVQVPTTLLSQVDSSVGGKVGINHRLGKNMIGAFHQPQLVLIDPNFLSTLPIREVRAGCAEIIKYGFIRDADFFNLVSDRLEELFHLKDQRLLETVLSTSCRIKAEIVKKDEREAGIRAVLNFGHTVGHALEAVTDYRYFLHGEAVVWGMQAAVFLSYLAGFISRRQTDGYSSILSEFQCPAIPMSCTRAGLKTAMMKDKKRSSKGQLWILLNNLGQAELVRDVAERDVDAALDFILQRD